MAGLLRAIRTIVDNSIVDFSAPSTGRNRINAVGNSLEQYVKDLFSDALSLDKDKKILRASEVFSYCGNTRNPPDFILKNGDAIEVKKIEKENVSLALNSSYPKAKLYADSPLINKHCKKCEDWIEKDIIYSIGCVKDSKFKYLWLVYGDCFAADKEIYENIRETISNGVNSIPDVDFAQTKELGQVKKVDPLGITTLRIRGMWHVENPHTIFKYLYNQKPDTKFRLFALMKKEKFDSFPDEEKALLFNIEDQNFSITDKKIQDPNNPAKLLDCKFIMFEVES